MELDRISTRAILRGYCKSLMRRFPVTSNQIAESVSQRKKRQNITRKGERKSCDERNKGSSKLKGKQRIRHSSKKSQTVKNTESSECYKNIPTNLSTELSSLLAREIKRRKLIGKIVSQESKECGLKKALKNKVQKLPNVCRPKTKMPKSVSDHSQRKRKRNKKNQLNKEESSHVNDKHGPTKSISLTCPTLKVQTPSTLRLPLLILHALTPKDLQSERSAVGTPQLAMRSSSRHTVHSPTSHHLASEQNVFLLHPVPKSEPLPTGCEELIRRMCPMQVNVTLTPVVPRKNPPSPPCVEIRENVASKGVDLPLSPEEAIIPQLDTSAPQGSTSHKVVSLMGLSSHAKTSSLLPVIRKLEILDLLGAGLPVGMSNSLVPKQKTSPIAPKLNSCSLADKPGAKLRVALQRCLLPRPTGEARIAPIDYRYPFEPLAGTLNALAKTTASVSANACESVALRRESLPSLETTSAASAHQHSTSKTESIMPAVDVERNPLTTTLTMPRPFDRLRKSNEARSFTRTVTTAPRPLSSVKKSLPANPRVVLIDFAREPAPELEEFIKNSIGRQQPKKTNVILQTQERKTRSNPNKSKEGEQLEETDKNLQENKYNKRNAKKLFKYIGLQKKTDIHQKEFAAKKKKKLRNKRSHPSNVTSAQLGKKSKVLAALRSTGNANIDTGLGKRIWSGILTK